MNNSLVVKLLTDTAIAPCKHGYEYAAGYDLYTDEQCTLQIGHTRKIATNVCVKIPVGYYGQIFERSSSAVQGLIVSGGVIDSDYRGPISIICNNASINDIVINKGMRIAQLVIIPIPTFNVVVTKDFDDDTQRGTSGFGSTGLY